MPTVILPCCAKIVHQPCLKHWMMSQSTCPYCRADIDPNVVFQSASSVTQESATHKNEVITKDSEGSDIQGTPQRPTDAVRAKAQAKTRKRQDVQAQIMQKRYKKSMNSMGVGPGAVVTIKNDYHDISHPLGTMGVVFDAKETGGIKVCTQWGIIVQGVSRVDYWIPRERYAVTFKAEDMAVISDELDTVRRQVLSNSFDEQSHKKVTLQEAHRALVGGESPKGKRKCRCKSDNCKPGCGCWNK